MDKELEGKERKLSLLETEGEVVSKEAEIAQKKALIREAKEKYGRDWKKMLFGAMGHLKVNTETMQTLHGMGIDNSLRDLSDPRKMGGDR